MKCDRYHNLLMRYFDHELDGHEQEALDQHLHSCPRCRALRDDLAGILNTLESVVMVEPEPDLERLVMNRVMSLSAYPYEDRITLPKLIYGTLAGLASLLFLMLGLSVQNMGYGDLILAGRDCVYWSSAILVHLQIAYGIVSSLFPEDISAAFREIQVASVLAVFVLVLVAVKTAVARLTVEGTDKS